eukprot:s272_g40.t1
MGGLLAKPITTKETEDGGDPSGRNGLAFGVSAMQGWREGMEDAHMAIPDFDSERQLGLFGVFDGHGGSAVAKVVAATFPATLKRQKSFIQGHYCEALYQVTNISNRQSSWLHLRPLMLFIALQMAQTQIRLKKEIAVSLDCIFNQAVSEQLSPCSGCSRCNESERFKWPVHSQRLSALASMEKQVEEANGIYQNVSALKGQERQLEDLVSEFPRLTLAFFLAAVCLHTGEGKTDVCAAIASILARGGRFIAVHIITSGEANAKKDFMATKDYIKAATGHEPILASDGIPWNENDEDRGSVVFRFGHFGFGLDKIQKYLSRSYALVDEADFVMFEQGSNQLYVSSAVQGYSALMPFLFRAAGLLDYHAEYDPAQIKTQTEVGGKIGYFIDDLKKPLKELEGSIRHDGTWFSSVPSMVDKDGKFVSIAQGALQARLKLSDQDYVVTRKQGGHAEITIVNLANGEEAYGSRWINEGYGVPKQPSAELKGPVEIVFKTIQECKAFESFLKNNGRGDDFNVIPFYRSSMHSMLEGPVPTNTIIIASNMGGRGLDIKLHKHDVLLVILTQVLDDRQDMQARGRCGRNGKPGVIQYQLLKSTPGSSNEDVTVTLVRSKYFSGVKADQELQSRSPLLQRDMKATKVLESFSTTRMPYIEGWLEKLFAGLSLKDDLEPLVKGFLQQFIISIYDKRWACWKDSSSPRREESHSLPDFRRTYHLSNPVDLGEGEIRPRLFQ